MGRSILAIRNGRIIPDVFIACVRREVEAGNVLTLKTRGAEWFGRLDLKVISTN